MTDDEVKDAMRFAFRHLNMVIEPGGAVPLAAILAGKIPTQDKTTVAVLSGTKRPTGEDSRIPD